MEFDQELLERVNPVFNTGKMTLFQLSATGDEDAKVIAEKLGLTFEETQNSSTTKATAIQQKIGEVTLETRYRTAGAIVEKTGCKTHVDLPCGFTPRGVQDARKGISYVGLDLPATVAEIELAVQSMLNSKESELVNYYGMDATNYASMEKALAKVEGEVCITTEGLLMYFTDSEVGMLCDNIRKILEKHGGCWIVADPEVTLQYVMTAQILLGDDFMKVMAASKKTVADKSDVEVGNAKILVKPGPDTAENMKTAMGFLAAHGLKVERLTVAEYMPELRSLKDEPEIAKAHRHAMEKNAFWKITPIGGTAQDEQTTVDENGFGVSASMNGGVLEMKLVGRVDTLTAPEVLTRFEELVAQETIDAVKVDCSRLDYVSSAGLRAFLIMHKKSANGMKLVAVSNLVNEILEQTGFDTFFEIERA